MFEQMQNQIQAVHEAVFATRDQMGRMFDERCGRVELRLDAVEIALRKNSEDIRKNSEDIQKNSEDIERLRQQLEGLTHVVEGKADEARVTRIEQRLGI